MGKLKNWVSLASLGIIMLNISGCEYLDWTLPDVSPSCKSVIENKELYMSSPDDPYRLDTVWFERDYMFLGIQYGGGCGDAFFQLYSMRDTVATDTFLVDLKLSLDDRDLCEALLYREVCYDIQSLQRFNPEGRFIQLRIADKDGIWRYEW